MRADLNPFRTVRPITWLGLVVGWCVASSAAGLVAAEPVSGEEFFETTIRHLLVERCHDCHGAGKQWAGLRLDSREALLVGGDSGPAIVPGQPDDSELVRRVAETDESLRMPPEEAGEALSPDEIKALRHWIASGAPWPAADQPGADAVNALARDHWAFQPIDQPAPPEVDRQDWPTGPLDRFVLARLEAADLQPSPEADRRTLIRRATYDLTGLPPTPEEVAAFVSDEAPDAYERLIDRLLASPRYGEHWGRHWLDVARYSDTKGYVYAREERFFVHASVYRDWVIRAFNRDLPYDQFLLLQLAADQIAPDAPRDLAAMGFLTIGRRFIGVTPDIIDDRIDVVTRGLMGLTVSCARCHDHKYDPIPTADYYSLYGVFQNCVQRLVPIPPADEAAAPTDAFQQELTLRREKLRKASAERRAEAGERFRRRLADYLLAQRELEKYPELGFDQVLSTDDLIPSAVRRWETYLARAAVEGDAVLAAWLKFAELPDEGFAEAASELTAELAADATINARVRHAFSEPPASIEEVAQRYGRLADKVDQEWTALCEAATAAGEPVPTALPDAYDEAVRQLLYGPNAPCVIADEPISNIEMYFDSNTVNELWKLQGEVDRWLLPAPESAPHALILTDRSHTVDPQIFRRGNPAQKEEFVPKQFVAVVAGEERQPFEHGSGRRELAEAIVATDNPLTARVWVNRVWQHHFGQGLVSTPSDFGLRADRPSHPELLDWLASEFVNQGWSTKWLHRTIMQSSTYRQRSAPSDDAAVLARLNELDPDNRLLSRMNARRLDFEPLRDTFVALSGELDMTPGGKAVELFPQAAPFRRSVYGLVDRQFLPGLLRVFDFANPDLHSPQRSETTVPQQALFALNDPFVAGRARALASRVDGETSVADELRVRRLYQLVFQRDPTPDELDRALAFLAAADEPVDEVPLPTIAAWSYGHGELDESAGRLKQFEPLPYFDGAAWQGGPQWPDATLGWVQLTATGGHTGNDLAHSAIRRWSALQPGKLRVTSHATHDVAAGDGIRCWIVSSRHGILNSATLHNSSEAIDVAEVSVEAGDRIDFVVDYRDNLNNDQFLWAPVVELIEPLLAGDNGPSNHATLVRWDAARDFAGPPRELLTPFEQLAQLLLISNEALFVD